MYSRGAVTLAPTSRVVSRGEALAGGEKCQRLRHVMAQFLTELR